MEIVPRLESWAENRVDSQQDRVEFRHTADAEALPDVQMIQSNQSVPLGLLVTSEFDGDYDKLAQVIRAQLPDGLEKQPVSLLLRTGGHALGFEFKKFAEALGIDERQVAEPTAFECLPNRIYEGVYNHLGQSREHAAWSLPYHRRPLGQEEKDETKFLLNEYPHLKAMLVQTEWMVKGTRDCPQKTWQQGSRENHYPYSVYYMEIWPADKAPEKSVRGSRLKGPAKILEQHDAMRQGIRVH